MKKIQTYVAIILFLFSSILNADSEVESLSPELRTLLVQEMMAIQKGMQSILPAYASGNFDEIADISKNIKDSFILKQTITDAQKKELGKKLPASFLKLDQKFHEHAGMLEHVAKMKNTELVGFYYSKLVETCVACHSEYATHKFPKFHMKSKSNTGNDHH